MKNSIFSAFQYVGSISKGSKSGWGLICTR